MKEFSLSDLNRRPGELVDEALLEPIVLTKHGRRQLVMLSSRKYEELLAQKEPGGLVPRPAAKAGKVSLNGLRDRMEEEQP